MEGFVDFVQMGGYGGYVWFCYGAAVAMKAGFLVVLYRRRRALLRRQ